MAKKKKAATKKPAKRRDTKKTPVAKKKASAAPKKATSPKKSGSRGTSVDTLLKKFENERRAKEAVLAGSKKQIEDLEQKVTKLDEQIAKLKTKASATQSEIDQLDSRRDAEVSELLVKLGVHLAGVPNRTSSAPPRPALTLGSSTLELDKES